MKKVLAALLIFVGSSALASPAQDVFDEVSYYLVMNYGGASSIDVRTLPDKYQPQLEAACMNMANTCPTEKAFPVINAMLREIGDEHTGFYPNLGSQVSGLLAGTNTNQSVGMDITVLENQVFVRNVVVGSAAAQAGIKRADRISHINFAPVQEKTFAAAWTKLNTQGGFVTVVRQGQVQRLRLLPSVLPVELPSLELRSDGIAVIKVPNFFGRGQGSIANQVHTLLSQAKNPKGVILELRDNFGGFVADCTGIAAAFLDNAINRFTARTAFGSADYFAKNNQIWLRRANTESMVFNFNNPVKYQGRVVVLQNKNSASCSEFLSSNLQETGRAVVLGETSAGVANTSVGFFILSDQSALQLSLNIRVDANGKRYPASVQPNELIADDLKTINNTGQDAMLERAIEILNAP